MVAGLNPSNVKLEMSDIVPFPSSSASPFLMIETVADLNTNAMVIFIDPHSIAYMKTQWNEVYTVHFYGDVIKIRHNLDY